MIDIKIPKDIEKYQTKLIGPFTLRQAICFGGGAFIAFTICRPLFESVDSTIASIVSALVMSPFLACGFLTPYGLPFEQFFVRVVLYSLLTPKKRKFKMDDCLKDYLTEKEKKQLKKIEKKCLNYKSKNPELQAFK